MKTVRFEIEKYPEKIVIKRILEIESEVKLCEPPEWLKSKGFDRVVYGYHGYGYARRENKWFFIDFQEQTVENETTSPYEDKNFLLSKVVAENEWGQWINNIEIWEWKLNHD